MRFANNHGQLVRVELPGTRRHRVSAKDATVERDFYLAEDQQGNLVEGMENLLAEIETSAATAIHQVVDEREWPVPANVRIAIAMWAAAQHLRTPAVRRAGNDIADTMLKLQIAAGGKPELRRILEAEAGAPVSDLEVDETWDLLTDFEDYQVKTHPNEHLRSMAELLPGTAQMFHDRSWTFVRFERKAIITTDAPVVLLPTVDHPQYLGVGLVTAGGVLVPLDRRVALLMGEPGTDDRLLIGTAKGARALNQNLAIRARRCVFHHPEDDPLRDIRLPEPRDRELDARDQIRRFLRPEGWPEFDPAIDPTPAQTTDSAQGKDN